VTSPGPHLVEIGTTWWLRSQPAHDTAETGGFRYLRLWLAELERIDLDGFEPFDALRPPIDPPAA
jgi:hypothetical protein